MTRWVVAGLAVLAVGLIAVLAASFGKDTHAVPFKLRGVPAPDFELTRIAAPGKVKLSALRGKPVVLNFWATWCGPCEEEDPVLQWGADRFGKDVQFLGILVEDTDDSARRFLSEHGGEHFPQLSDPPNRVAVDYGFSGVPETYFIDADGQIVDKWLGAISPDALTEGVARLLGHPAAPGPGGDR